MYWYQRLSYNLDRMCTEVRQAYEAGKRYSIIVVSEGAGSAVELGKQVGRKPDDTRVTVLATFSVVVLLQFRIVSMQACWVRSCIGPD